MNNERLIRTFSELCQISSPTGHENAVADYIMDALRPYPVRCIQDEAGKQFGGQCGNLIVDVGQGQPSLLLDAHMDTVGPCERITVKRSADRLESDQTSILGADDKAGVAILLELIRMVHEHDQPVPVFRCVFSVSEEVSLRGVKGLDPRLLEGIRTGLILDGEGKPGQVTVQSPFSWKGTLRIQGREAHAGVEPEKGIHALVIAADAINQLKVGRINAQTTFNIGLIEGGTATNVVMGCVTMTCEARSLDEQELISTVEQVKTIFTLTAEKHQGRYTIDERYGTKGYKLSSDNPVLLSLQRTAASLGLPYGESKSGGASNVNIYRSRGLNAVDLGVGMQAIHSVHEFIEIPDLLNACRLVYALVSELTE